MTFADKVLSFYKSLSIDKKLPKGVEVLNPYQDEDAFKLCQSFYRKFYNDKSERIVILGINPGRLGGGITGIPFTDPIKLEKFCGIDNNMKKKPELSADFMYQMIDAFGGPKEFYSKFFFSSISPLGFIKDGKNINYYDFPELQQALSGFIEKSMHDIHSLGISTEVALCLGEGQNFKFFIKLNDNLKLFKQIIPLAHPRFIMQYKRKSIHTYIDDYISKLNNAIKISA